MPRGVSHDEEFSRVASKEYNVMKPLQGWGPSKRFGNKGQMQAGTNSGGINRPLNGKGASSKNYSGSAQSSGGK